MLAEEYTFESLDGQLITEVEAEAIQRLVLDRREHMEECSCESGTHWCAFGMDEDGDPVEDDPYIIDVVGLCIHQEGSMITIVRLYKNGNVDYLGGKVRTNIVEVDEEDPS